MELQVINVKKKIKMWYYLFDTLFIYAYVRVILINAMIYGMNS